ncbi:Hypothetical protein CINCED_3A002451 [Cinara cedri]|uniref:Uncharacterized protein n=1 Tax=Cinara cedri TaxID=506608 RepID=A0A5E4MU99_9HEMI|nr:Hypothetical protein CINCED_3A002451 [Cinara cedri]
MASNKNPIECIFICHFHHTAGPRILCQRNLEIERNFLSNSDQSDDSQEQLFCMLNKVMQDLNKDNTCILTVCGAVIYLNVIKVSPDPLIPLNFDVPVLLSPINHSEHQWDLVTERISPYINGVNHVSRIVELSKLSIEIVTACIQNLIYCNAVSLVDLFRYSNMYICTTQIVQFVKNKSRHQEAINFISAANAPKAKFKDIFSMYSAMKRGARYIDICLSFNPRKLNINERNLVLYGLSNGYIRQLRKYPVLLKSSDVNKTILGNYFNGRNSLNIISCYSRSNVYTLDLAIERDKRIVSVWK